MCAARAANVPTHSFSMRYQIIRSYIRIRLNACTDQPKRPANRQTDYGKNGLRRENPLNGLSHVLISFLVRIWASSIRLMAQGIRYGICSIVLPTIFMQMSCSSVGTPCTTTLFSFLAKETNINNSICIGIRPPHRGTQRNEMREKGREIISFKNMQ